LRKETTNMGKRLVLGCLLAALLPGLASAGGLEIDFSSDTARAIFGWDVRGERLGLDVGWLHEDDEGDVGHLGFVVQGDVAAGSARLKAGVGGRTIFVDTDEEEGFALALGGFLRYPLPAHERLVLGIEAYFAPEIFSGSDLDHYHEVTIRAGYQILDRAAVHVGYRYAKASYESLPSSTLDENVHIGIRLEF
jgi:hypothetical protein